MLEVLIVIGIITIVAGIVTGSFSVFKRNNDIKFVVEQSIGILKDARAKTLSSEGDSQYGVHFESSQVVLFTGPAYNPSDASNITYTLPATVLISNTALAGGGVEVVFKRLTGETAQPGSVTFQLVADAARLETITIQSTGLVYVQ